MKILLQKLLYLASFYLVVSCAIPDQYLSDEYSGNDNYSYDSDPIGKEPGKCYAKCLMGDVFEEEKSGNSIPIYAGTDVDQDFVEKREIVISEPTTKWAKRKADKNCLSADPNDCLVWCLVEVPGETIEAYVVTDTSQTDDYYWEDIPVKKLVQKGGFTKWEEVICDYEVTAELNQQIQQALIKRGYDADPTSRVIGTRTKAALVKFQKNNNLPIGNLNIKTMDALGIDY